MPIYLIKDVAYGEFSTLDMERYFGVSIFPTNGRHFGWGFGKLEPLFQTERKRCLILDADTLMIGGMLDELNRYDEDFLVTKEDPPNEEFVEKLYFDLTKLKKLDADFRFPGFTFNTGQLVATTGLLQRADFEPFVAWEDKPRLKQPDIFRCGDQGVLNYVLMKKQAQGSLSLRRIPMMVVADSEAISELGGVGPSTADRSPVIIHWCGQVRNPTSAGLVGMHGRRMLLEYEKWYYQHLPWGPVFRPVQLALYEMRAKLTSVLRNVTPLANARRKVRELRGALAGSKRFK